MLDEKRFRDLWDRLGCGRIEVFSRLIEAYSQPSRAYHNARHIVDCLTQFDQIFSIVEMPDEVEAAIWFHDAVYDPRKSDNEQRSADWAVESMIGADTPCIERVSALILATQHLQEVESRDAKLLLDIDLSILGRVPDVFKAYDDAIREEYHWVPIEQYLIGRAAILQGFLHRSSVYHTDHFRNRFEHQARENLAGCIAKLKTK